MERRGAKARAEPMEAIDDGTSEPSNRSSSFRTLIDILSGLKAGDSG